MLQRPPRLTRTYPLCPYTTLFRSVDDRLAQRHQPMPVTRNEMAAYQNQDLALSGLAAQVQRAAEGELHPGDVGDQAARLFGNGQSNVGRTRVDEHGLELQPLRLLAGHAFTQARKSGVEGRRG